ncbi:hypothetical protein MOQ_004676 [Trypanosoma cruzi marinkellei]|uniref:PDZ domain-containing protein n=1 Tax=Trypanosoma cruzi marinkellei TaxID=85056 RepID=K2N9G2_TRYCR|nr:hypothetical protein MOQ_004676 [Trypanosoma cruzi marinkellei]
MLFAVESRPSTGAVDSLTTADELNTTGNTLTQLQNFFEQHTFDTCGPYSDLFSVLLSCCKHLVDANLHHHAVLLKQRREVTRLASETEALYGVTARCQEGIHELKLSSLEPHSLGQREKSPLRSVSASPHASRERDDKIIWDRLEELNGHIHETRAAVVDLRRRQEEIEGRLREECRQKEEGCERVRHLEEMVDGMKRGISAHSERVDREFAKLENLLAAAASSSSPVEQVSEIKQYTDKKVESLRNELFTALQETSLETEMSDAKLPISQPSKGCTSVVASNAIRVRDSSGGKTDARHDTFASGSRRPVSGTLRSIFTQIEELESRLEAIEVYAPHRCAMAARPPLLGVELRDEKGIGVRIVKVFHGFDGEAAGMMPGDVVVAVNGQEVLTRAEMYAVMTELVREYQSRCRLLKELYFKQHVQLKKNAGGLMSTNHNSSLPVIGEEVRTNLGLDSCWEILRLELKFHLKRGDLLCEVGVVVEANEDGI